MSSQNSLANPFTPPSTLSRMQLLLPPPWLPPYSKSSPLPSITFLFPALWPILYSLSEAREIPANGTQAMHAMPLLHTHQFLPSAPKLKAGLRRSFRSDIIWFPCAPLHLPQHAPLTPLQPSKLHASAQNSCSSHYSPICLECSPSEMLTWLILHLFKCYLGLSFPDHPMRCSKCSSPLAHTKLYPCSSIAFITIYNAPLLYISPALHCNIIKQELCLICLVYHLGLKGSPTHGKCSGSGVHQGPREHPTAVIKSSELFRI